MTSEPPPLKPGQIMARVQRTIPILFFLEAIQQPFYISFLGKTFSQGILFKIELRAGIAPPT